jgi:transcriptional regulator with XRE-family HTH domain
MAPTYQDSSSDRKDKRGLPTDMPVHDVGRLLCDWRRRRRMSQFDLACAAEISTRHLSFLETGRSRPSRQMMLRLATTLQVPLRDRNALLAAAGFATTFQEHPFNAPALDVVRRNVESLLATHAPNPALAVDRHWTMLTANRAVAHLVAGAEPMLLRPPVNVVRLFLHPAGLASRIVNLAQWRAHTIERLRRQIDASGDPVLTDLLEEVRDYTSHGTDRPEDDAVALPLRLATFDGVLSFFNTTTSFATPLDITVAELTVETFLPADLETAAIMRRVSAGDETRFAAAQPVDALA